MSHVQVSLVQADGSVHDRRVWKPDHIDDDEYLQQYVETVESKTGVDVIDSSIEAS